ncbi:uncharacterized protein G2W53_040125 [Senna tora]|uniref:Uncharacterized protein n=1 Tax=Senna tora TaxID=362788 RepID=A0A834W8K9_9FABA|nr:uncharacterized protein G2W53_040125 [Senna tora]
MLSLFPVSQWYGARWLIMEEGVPLLTNDSLIVGASAPQASIFTYQNNDRLILMKLGMNQSKPRMGQTLIAQHWARVRHGHPWLISRPSMAGAEESIDIETITPLSFKALGIEQALKGISYCRH